MPAEEQLKQAKEEISKALRVRMIERGISQTELASMLHTSKQSVNMAIKGGSADYLVRIRRKIYKILDMDGK